MLNVVILGSTGSIGRQALEVIESLELDCRVTALAAHSNYQELLEQCRRFSPSRVALVDENSALQLKESSGELDVEILQGQEGLIELASDREADLVMVATVGFSGFLPTLYALRNGRKVALANKESLVVGGELLAREVPEYKELIIPVDSEHSAIYQCLQGEKRESVKKLILTASGGPFLNTSPEHLPEVTPAQALKHPNWAMGPRITIDSATFMNKGFEVLEAGWLFGVELENIEVVVHPQSIVHSLVEYQDGSVLAQMGTPDMRVPIQYSLTAPGRKSNSFPALDLNSQSLSFHEPDTEKFPCLRLAYEAGKTGGTMPACLNAADEVAVELFLKGIIKFTDIAKYVEMAMKEHELVSEPSLEDIIEADRVTRNELKKIVARLG